MICAYYGKSYSISYLRKKAFTTREGVSLLGLSNAAESLGFHSAATKLTFAELKAQAELPCIVHWNEQHFIVLYGIKGNSVHVADPARGRLVYTEREFCKYWASIKELDEPAGVALFVKAGVDFEKNNNIATASKEFKSLRLSQYFMQYKGLIAQLVVCLLLGSLLQLALPLLTQAIVDNGINFRNISFIYLIVVGQLILFVGRMSIEVIRRWVLLHLSARINISLVSDFLIKLFKLPMSFFEEKMIGDIIVRIEDHSRIERVISTSSLSILLSLFNVLVFGGALLLYNQFIFVIFISFSVVYIFYLSMFLKRRETLDYKRYQEVSNNQSNLVQLVQGMGEIKMNNCELKKRWEWERIQASLFRVNADSIKLQQYQDLGSIFLNEFKNILITAVSAIAVIEGSMTFGAMVSVQYIVGQLNAPINDFVSFSRQWQDAKISLSRINEIHTEVEETELNDLSANIEDICRKSIVLKNVSFQYGGPDSPKVLDDINLIVPAGKVTAIVGTSGSGKTTLLKLLLKMYQPTAGAIYIDGIPIDTIDSRRWRSKCGAVMQEGFIFADSIENNIALYGDQLESSRVFRSATVANIHSFIESLAMKYRTKVGINGVGLSEGQKQRLLIARAVYKDPAYIFLDEATSSLDANNEKDIMRNLGEFLKNKTVVVVAHRLSTVKNADSIVVLEGGRIMEVGSHSDLVALRGRYLELVKNQLELAGT